MLFRSPEAREHHVPRRADAGVAPRRGTPDEHTDEYADSDGHADVHGNGDANPHADAHADDCYALRYAVAGRNTEIVDWLITNFGFDWDSAALYSWATVADVSDLLGETVASFQRYFDVERILIAEDSEDSRL